MPRSLHDRPHEIGGIPYRSETPLFSSRIPQFVLITGPPFFRVACTGRATTLRNKVSARLHFTSLLLKLMRFALPAAATLGMPVLLPKRERLNFPIYPADQLRRSLNRTPQGTRRVLTGELQGITLLQIQEVGRLRYFQPVGGSGGLQFAFNNSGMTSVKVRAKEPRKADVSRFQTGVPDPRLTRSISKLERRELRTDAPLKIRGRRQAFG